tara:strand:- start:536 stop:1153 length:618 start_codon:yes stop_codon:yes gene_type:complete
MLRKIKLYGDLAKVIGHKEFEDIYVLNVAQAVSFLINNFPQLESYMSTRYYKVLANNEEIGENEIHYPIGKSDISFVPVIQGSGGGLGRVLAGAALIGIAFATAGTGVAAAGGLFTKAGFAAAGFGTKAALGIGAGLLLGGVSEMLFPMPKQPEFSSEQDPRLSFSFSGTQQTSRAGTPVPIVYGEIFTGSVVISGGIDTEQVQA